MVKRLAMIALVCGSIAFAKTYNFRLSERSQVCTAQLKPGEYSLKVDGSQVILKDNMGHQIDVLATAQDGERKFEQTAVVLTKVDGTNRIQSVQLGGSKTTIVFQSGQADRTE